MKPPKALATLATLILNVEGAEVVMVTIKELASGEVQIHANDSKEAFQTKNETYKDGSYVVATTTLQKK